ncbi:Purine permease 1 [Platanthera guangdongensis]|uniref:Purine permease 1 n=1 Tax=Platanthera guangdongensis TaxID=2320717 RepID=A0ABR2M921_9ASPA
MLPREFVRKGRKRLSRIRRTGDVLIGSDPKARIIAGRISDYLYSYGISFLPVSTSSILISTQLGFTAIFAFFTVKQKLTSFSMNTIVMFIFGAAVLGVQGSDDKPDGESKLEYFIGYLLTLGAAVTYGLLPALMELMYKHAKKEVTYALVMEMQFIIGFTTTIFCTIGMAISRDFQAISKEAKNYELGQSEYYFIVFLNVVITQLFYLGLVGTIKYSSALLSGVVEAICVPITEVFAVFIFHENFGAEKGVSLAISLWGTGFYFYGEYIDHKRKNTAVRISVTYRLIPENKSWCVSPT